MVRFATGVGLVFKEIPGDGVQVQSVLKGGGAALSSHPPKSGDRLLAVDAQDARRQTLSALRHLIVGDEVCLVGKECMFDCQFEFVLECERGGSSSPSETGTTGLSLSLASLLFRGRRWN